MPIEDSNIEAETPLETAAESGSPVEFDEAGLANTKSPITVFVSSDASEAEIIRGLLESEGIPAFFDSQPGMSLPRVIMGETMHGAVMVAAENEDRAKELIAAYSKPISDAEIEAAEDESGV